MRFSLSSYIKRWRWAVGEHRINALTQVLETKQNTFHWSILNLLIGLAYRNAFVLISHRAQWHIHGGSLSLYSRGTDRFDEHSQAKAWKTDYCRNNGATHTASSGRYTARTCPQKKADFKHRPCVWKRAQRDSNRPQRSFTAEAVRIRTFHSDSFVFHNTHPIIEKIKYANLGR